MRAVPSLAVVLILAALGLGACGVGEDGGDEAVHTDSPRSGAQDLHRFLMSKDEVPGFSRVERPRTVTGVEAYVKDIQGTQADAQRLRSEGFIKMIYQPIRGPRTDGVTSITLFANAEGARHHMAHEVSTDVIRTHIPGANIRRFTVPGVPGARGWTTATGPHRIGNAFWVQGRCVLVLGNEGPGPFDGPLSTGARAIYERTNGQCP